QACPKCGGDDESMRERTDDGWFCNICSHDWATGRSAKASAERSQRFKSLDELIARTGLRRDEVVTLADLGALNAFGYDRRSALWQAERAVRPSGELFEENLQLTIHNLQSEGDVDDESPEAESLRSRPRDSEGSATASGGGAPRVKNDDAACPLKPMTEAERLVADYAGMGLTAGRHPMALRRDELATRGVLRAVDLRTTRHGRRV